MRPRPRVWLALFALPLAALGGEEDVPNLPPPLAVHALIHARLIPAAGEVIDDATVVLRDGRIEAAGADAVVPADARVWDLTGRSIYPGLIDAFSDLGASGDEKKKEAEEPGGDREAAGPPGPAHSIASVHPEVRAADRVRIDEKTRESWRKAEIGIAHV